MNETIDLAAHVSRDAGWAHNTIDRPSCIDPAIIVVVRAECKFKTDRHISDFEIQMIRCDGPK